MKLPSLFLSPVVAASALIWAHPVNAASIALVNGSLESPSYYNPGDPYPGWAGLNGSIGFSGWSTYGTRGASPVAQDGSQSLWSGWSVGWCGLSQDSSYTVGSAGETLSAYVWAKTESSGNVGPGGVWFNLQLLLDGVQVSFAQPNLSAGTDWTQITTSYVTTTADIGKIVGISFGTDGGASAGYPNYAYMDNASLSAVPEPGTTLLGGLAVLCLLRRRR